MSTLGTGITQSVAGLNQAQRIVAQDKEKADKDRPSARRVRNDQPDEVVVGLETAEAVRSLKDNTHEEAREDHAQHPTQEQADEHRRDGHHAPKHVPTIAGGDSPQAAPSAASPEGPLKHIDLEG